MGKNNEVLLPEYKFTCFKCGSIIKPGEKMLTVSARLETPNRDGSIKRIGSPTVSSVCSSCASLLSSEMDIVASESKDELGRAALSVHCSEHGFYFNLQCSDGISWANSRLFSWQQIAQLLIAAASDIFGALDKPLHQVFPQNLVLLGYHIPNWQ